jgi:hypothetical protein
MFGKTLHELCTQLVFWSNAVRQHGPTASTIAMLSLLQLSCMRIAVDWHAWSAFPIGRAVSSIQSVLHLSCTWCFTKTNCCNINLAINAKTAAQRFIGHRLVVLYHLFISR